MEKIKVYTMSSCPDCISIKEKLSENPDYDFIDIGNDVRNMKEFLLLRDSRKEFRKIIEDKKIGIPCFLYPDGRISFEAKEMKAEKSFCSLDGKGC
jgi:glutaredoxin-related protein